MDNNIVDVLNNVISYVRFKFRVEEISNEIPLIKKIYKINRDKNPDICPGFISSLSDKEKVLFIYKNNISKLDLYIDSIDSNSIKKCIILLNENRKIHHRIYISVLNFLQDIYLKKSNLEKNIKIKNILDLN